MNPTLHNYRVRVTAHVLTLEGTVTDHPEHDDGTHIQTAAILDLSLRNHTAQTKGTTYNLEGEPN